MKRREVLITLISVASIGPNLFSKQGRNKSSLEFPSPEGEGVSPSTAKRTSKNAVIYCGPASLRWVGEMPLLYIKGTPYEKGFQYGALLKNELRRAVDLRYYEYVYVIGKSDKEIKDMLSAFARENRAEFPEDMLQMFHGMSDGSEGEVSYEECYGLNSCIAFPSPGPIGCSSFTKVLADGTFIYAHNADWLNQEMYADSWITVVEEHQDGKRMVLNSNIGWLGPQNGMNDRGICVGGASRFPLPQKDYKPDFRFPLRVFYDFRVCLENAGTLDGAKELCPDAGLMASGKERKASICEKTYRHQECLDAKDGFAFATNSYVNEKCQEDDGSLGASFNGDIQCARYKRYAELLEDCDTIEDAAAILRDGFHYYSRIKTWGEIFYPPLNLEQTKKICTNPFAWETIGNRMTQHSVIMLPEKGMLFVNTGGVFCSLKTYYGITINGKVNDDWNQNPPVIAANRDAEKGMHYLRFNREMEAASGNFKTAMNLCRKYSALDPDVPVYPISLACWQHNENPRLALETATKLQENYPGHYDLARLIPRMRISLFMETNDIKLLETNEKELRPYLLQKEKHLDMFIADVGYLLIRSLILSEKMEAAHAVYSDLENYLMGEKYAKTRMRYDKILNQAKKEIEDISKTKFH